MPMNPAHERNQVRAVCVERTSPVRRSCCRGGDGYCRWPLVLDGARCGKEPHDRSGGRGIGGPELEVVAMLQVTAQIDAHRISFPIHVADFRSRYEALLRCMECHRGAALRDDEEPALHHVNGPGSGPAEAVGPRLRKASEDLQGARTAPGTQALRRPLGPISAAGLLGIGQVSRSFEAQYGPNGFRGNRGRPGGNDG